MVVGIEWCDRSVMKVCEDKDGQSLAPRWRRGFTLVELLAVVLVLLILTAIGFGVAGYVQKKMAIATTTSQIAAIEAALESYKSDWGYYPPTSPYRISGLGNWEVTNNAVLYRALYGQRKRYLSFPQSQVHVSYFGTGYGGTERSTLTATNLFDVWGMPFNYYCSPTTPYSLSNSNRGFTMGGQVNVATFDLFSYGRDHATLADLNAAWPPVIGGAAGAENVTWSNINSTVDDVKNWGP